MSFKDFIEKEISKPAPKHYDPNGNSTRAIVTRGRFKEIIYQYKRIPMDIVDTFSAFDGFNTPIGWFLLLPIYILLLPILPSLQGLYSYRKAIEEYKTMYVDKLHR